VRLVVVVGGGARGRGGRRGISSGLNLTNKKGNFNHLSYCYDKIFN